MKAQEAIDHIEKYHAHDEVVCMVLWTKDDIEYVLDELNISLTRKEVDIILNHLETKADFNTGITWTTVQNVIKYRRKIGIYEEIGL